MNMWTFARRHLSMGRCNCWSCAPVPGKDRARLRKAIRTKLKRMDAHDLEEA